MKGVKRILSAALAVLMLLTVMLTAVGCTRVTTLLEVEPTAEEKRVVGKVGEFDIYYDELRYITMTYKVQMEEKYGEGIWKTEQSAAPYIEELEKKVFESITANYAALAVAKENAAAIGVLHRAELNCLDVTAQKIEGKFDAVLSNPPYVTEKSYEALMPEIYFEPKIAFVGGGDDGASFYERITALYRDSLTDGGFIAFEIGYDQKNVIESIAKRHQMSCEVQKDLGGNWRLAILKNEK